MLRILLALVIVWSAVGALQLGQCPSVDMCEHKESNYTTCCNKLEDLKRSMVASVILQSSVVFMESMESIAPDSACFLLCSHRRPWAVQLCYWNLFDCSCYCQSLGKCLHGGHLRTRKMLSIPGWLHINSY